MATGLYIREFLNLPGHHAGAYVLADLDDEGGGSIKIADCSKIVEISVDTYDPGSRINTIHKLKRLRSALDRSIRLIERTWG